jgi:GNAT superfamily N-acetyltransferase
MHFILRRATACDADAIANVFSASFRLLNFLPMLHTVEEDRRFIANVILKEFEVTVAEDETGIVAFLARRGEEVRLLYTRPDRIGMGAGSQLIEASKATGVGALELWCFQANERARRFYEARGFHAVRFTDGADNEEQMPDIRYQSASDRDAAFGRDRTAPGRPPARCRQRSAPPSPRRPPAH